MKRYKFLTKDSLYEALNKLRNAFLAAKDGNEVEEIILAALTQDERIKIGRRIQIAQMLIAGFTNDQIRQNMKVGLTTVSLVNRKLDEHPVGYELINKREEKIEKDYKQNAYRKIGGPKQIHKWTEYTGFKRKDVKR